jgi:hypothetical protein
MFWLVGSRISETESNRQAVAQKRQFRYSEAFGKVAISCRNHCAIMQQLAAGGRILLLQKRLWQTNHTV